MKKMQQNGFTLVELLVAMLVFALLTGFAYRSVSELSSAARILNEEDQQLKLLQQGISIIERDLRQSSRIEVADNEEVEGSNAGASSEDPSVEFLFSLSVVGAGKNKGNIEYSLDQGVLYRNTQVGGEESEKQKGLTLISELEGVEVNLLEGEGAVGLELILNHLSLGQVTRLIQLPANDLAGIPEMRELNTLKRYDQPQ